MGASLKESERVLYNWLKNKCEAAGLVVSDWRPSGDRCDVDIYAPGGEGVELYSPRGGGFELFLRVELKCLQIVFIYCFYTVVLSHPVARFRNEP